MRHAATIATGLCLLVGSTGPALAEKPGGVLKVYFFDSPASMSIHEEATIAGEGPMMGVFNNLVMFKQDVPQSGLGSVVPDLAESWSWNADGTALTFKLRRGIKWHDGKPFTAGDVKCTWDLLLERSAEKLRVNPRKPWWRNLEAVAVTGDHEATFRLKRPQPSFLALLAAGFSPVYPCHVPPRDMRSKPIGTGPFKFVEFKPNEIIRVTRNPDYWKPGRPYLDGIEWTIIRSTSTGVLAFASGKFDMTSPYFFQVPIIAEAKSQAPQAICELVPSNVSRNVIINRQAPPFDKPELRRAIILTLDRKAFIDTLTQGKGDIGGAMLPRPEGIWGMPPEMVKTLPGYDADVQKNRGAARKIMASLGYGPD
jgi:peptide/nickel transport system substrate-binding protein